MAVLPAETGTAAAPQGSSSALAEAFKVYGQLVLDAQAGDPEAKKLLDDFHAQQQAHTDQLRQVVQETEALIIVQAADLTARGISVPPRP